MSIILLELKKILNWKLLLLIAFVNVILYYFLIDFHIKHFPYGNPAPYIVGKEMVKTYGPEMTAAEVKDFKKKYDAEVRKADQFIQSREDFAEVGIHSYKDFRQVDGRDVAKEKLTSKFLLEESHPLFWKLQEKERLLDFHQNHDLIMNSEMSKADSTGKKHLTQLKQTGQFNLYPETSYENFRQIIENIAIVVLLSLVLVISPIFLRDRSQHLVDLQYTSKIGRQLFKRKLAAGLISAFLLMTVLLGIYLCIYSANNPSVFFDVPINSFVGGKYWYNLTFFQDIVLSVVAIYVMGFILTFVSMGISTLAPSMIVLIGAQVPLVLALLIFGLKYLLFMIVTISLPIWLIPSCFAALMVITTAFILSLSSREKRVDIVA
ncbi:hypothetical protein [Pseudoneobacillus sp. C159]